MIGQPKDQGLYEARNERDACGVGAVVSVKGMRQHKIIQHAKQVLLNLHHRGAAGADGKTGDGAGILSQIPHDFFINELAKKNVQLPKSFAVGMMFLPVQKELQQECQQILEQSIEHYGMKILAWRDVPTDNSTLGKIALSSEPIVKQIFVDPCVGDETLAERRLYMVRKRAENKVHYELGESASDFYISSLSVRTVCYKGMFMAQQLFDYYPDLADESFVSAIAVVHQRYSTNTFPSWKLAQPFRCIAHNGEINTISGNRKKMHARELRMSSDLFGSEIQDLFPVLEPQSSDSASFDNVLELLTHGGRTMPHSMMMMIPEAFGSKYHISADKRAFYEYHSCIMEPWDGPAAMVFTDGKVVGGMLDRNGLRPCRYVHTKDDLVIMASEAGVVEIPAADVRTKGRLQPGKMFLIDTVDGRIVTDNEVKSKISRQKPYRRWIQENRIELRGLFQASKPESVCEEEIKRKLVAFGYNREELKMILAPMAMNGQEPVGSMGNDAALAVLSDKPKGLFNYFKQLFAQVTNPPIDPLREGLVMSLMLHIGRRPNILEETAAHCHLLKLPHPILSNEDVQHLRSVKRDDFRIATIHAVFEANAEDPSAALKDALEQLLEQAQQAIKKGASALIISDRSVDQFHVPIPILLATAYIHNGLVAKKLRGEAGLIIETAEAREVMHFCLLIGYGANAVNPYLAMNSLDYLQNMGEIPSEVASETLIDNYIASIKKGLLKTMSKMGISTIRSYRGAQLFEAIGLNKQFVDEFFPLTSSRISGIGLKEIAVEAMQRHQKAFADINDNNVDMEFGGEYHWRRDGEKHLWNPVTISKLQQAVRNNDQQAYYDYANAVNNQAKSFCTLRGLFDFTSGKSIDISKVEPASEIVKRFCTGAMSHGSISKEAHECMAIAMNRIGAMSNTGEGGEDPQRYIPLANGDSSSCAIKQVASGRFGVTINYLSHAKEIQIKMAQGAKPGEGGQLPGEKVTQDVANLRFSTPGVTLISPPPHHDIYSIEDLAQLIYDLKASNPDAKISVKLVSEVGVGTIAAGVAKAGAHEVLISGFDGGTGASPLSSIKHAGIPWELGLAETQQVLVLNGLRDRIRVQTDGQLRTGRDVVIGALLGAQRFGFGTSALVSLGCVLMRKCHLGTCPAGIATQNAHLRSCFTGMPEHLVRYMYFVAEEVRQIMAQLGYEKFDDMVGHAERLQTKDAIDHWKARGLDFSAIFYVPNNPESPRNQTTTQPDKHSDHKDWKLIEQIKSAERKNGRISLDVNVQNTDRSFGTILSNYIVKQHGPDGLEDDSIVINASGSAGQSFGAFLVKGVTLNLTGEANDYVGKGLSGGKIIIQVPAESTYLAHENIIAANTLLYGATSGQVYINGVVGERFGVRNSGVTAVVEGVGDHGCEYMTNGRVVVLGHTGRNFAAGMSGGIAYVFDEVQLFDTLCNLDMVELECVYQKEDKEFLKDIIQKHYEYTSSQRAKYILDAWPNMVGRFVKVMPIDYRKALEKLKQNDDRNTQTTSSSEEVCNG